jgi:hypothetical protein
MIFISSFMPSIATILGDSVSAIAVQVCYYYGLAGWFAPGLYRESLQDQSFAHFPRLCRCFRSSARSRCSRSGSTPSPPTTPRRKIVGIGGLVIGIVFYPSEPATAMA